jgi:transposase
MEEGQDNLIEEPKEFRKIEIITAGGEQKVLFHGRPYMSWRCEDQVAPRVAIVQMCDSGLASQEELATLFGVHERSIRNYIAAYNMAGISGLVIQPKGPRESWKITPETRFKILEIAYGNRNMSYARLAEILKGRWNAEVSINSIRQVLMENGFIEERIKRERRQPMDLFGGADESLELDFKEADDVKSDELSAETKGSVGSDRDSDLTNMAKDRSCYSQAERIYLDELERGVWSAYAGGLLFVPLIGQYHFLEMIKRVIDIPTHEGYSLQQLSLTLFYFDVFEFRSIEDFKTVYPEEYGPLIGRAGSPSIYTLRRFLHRVRELKRGEELIDEFCREYLRLGLVQWGVMYIDSHFLPYYGMRVITWGWHGVQDKAFKGSYQFLAVDEKFNPFIFLLRPSSEDLLEKIPELIEKARALGRETGIAVEDLTVIFDREGYSAELFRKLDGMQPKVKFITWAKYMDQWVGDYKEEQFDKSVMIQYEVQDEEEIKYFETERMMNKYGKVRVLVIESGRKKQRSAIFTNSDAEGEKIIQLICRRWGQETLNKTHKWDHRMDYFPGYVDEELDEQPLVKNPKLKELKRQKANAVGKLNDLRIRFARKAFAEGKDDANWKEMKENNKELCIEMASLQAQVTLLDLEISKFPKEIRFDEAHDGKQLVELDYEKKRFLDCIKVFTYMMEKKMCSILSRYYDDPKDVYVILSMIVRRSGEMKLERSRLRVRLKGFKNPEVDFAARRLCEELNQMLPRTLDKHRLPIHYEVA